MHQSHGQHDEHRDTEFAVNGSCGTADGEQDEGGLSRNGVFVVTKGETDVHANQAQHQDAQDLAFGQSEVG